MSKKSWTLDIKDFGNYLKLERSLSQNSVDAYVHDVQKLSQFVELKYSDTRAEEITSKQLQGFLQYLNEIGMGAHSQARILSGIKGFFKYLLFEERINGDPTSLIEGPRLGRNSIRHSVCQQRNRNQHSSTSSARPTRIRHPSETRVLPRRGLRQTLARHPLHPRRLGRTLGACGIG